MESPTSAGRYWIGAAAAAVASVLARVPVLRYPLSSDEGAYAVAISKAAAGFSLYRDQGNVRPPGLFAFYDLALRLQRLFHVGPGIMIRAVSAIPGAFGTAAFFVYARRRFGVLATWTGTAMLVVLGASVALGNEANAESFFVPFTLVGGVLVASLLGETGLSRRSVWTRALIAGVMVGAAIMMKPPAAVAIGLPVAAAVADRRWRYWAKLAVLFWGGVAAGLVPFIAWAAATRQLADMFVFNWVASYVYVSRPLPQTLGETLAKRLPPVALPILLPLAAILGLLVVAAVLCRDRERWTPVVFAAGWFALSVVGVAASSRYYEHYFIQLIPAMVLAFTAGLDMVARPEDGSPATKRAGWRWAGIVLASVAVLAATGSLGRDYLTSPDNRMLGPVGGRRLVAASKPTDKVFVWGAVFPVLVYADRESSTVTYSYYPMRFPYPGWKYGSASDSSICGVRVTSGADVVLAEWRERLPDVIMLEAPLDDSSINPLEPADDLRVVRRLRQLLPERYEKVAAWTQPRGRVRRAIIYALRR